MSDYRYHVPQGGLPAQSTPLDSRAVFTEAYAFLPAVTMSDITTSLLPHWEATRLWVIARPLSGFAETFSHYLMDIAPGGGSETPEPDQAAQGVLFVVSGHADLTIGRDTHALEAGSYVYLPAGCRWTLLNSAEDQNCRFHWVRKAYDAVDGVDKPDPFVTHDRDVEPIAMPDTEGRWATSRFVDPTDLRHDMHLNIVTFQPGGLIPFPETHVMEHGIFVIEGKADYLLNKDWIAVEEGDFMWLRAFCPQACHVAEDGGRFRYLLYKDVNRHAKLGSLFG
ncbi:bifunctional allantoicase/(S)-ureidoglycine aminohydrolase [Pseudahrensia aquimaris]|uniref:Bifunctional allantoicase/(S)-ureidoglycine aminohydrolase n=1 Tax=Pseudahrensia aquimaris TaxID=744461 RepID=A0ABW3FCQ3_9HYPH